MNILLTGANGFLGYNLLQSMEGSNYNVTGVIRREKSQKIVKNTFKGSVDGLQDWTDVLADKDVVVHVAGVAHKKNKVGNKVSDDFRNINFHGTKKLAIQSAKAGVKRFIFISSIGVNGATSNRPFTEKDEPHPSNEYTRSKYEAEQALWEIAETTEMQVTIIRPPLIYGPNAPGNFGSLVKWISKGVPLPLGAINNKRSLVGVDNLVDLIETCIEHPAAGNEVFLAGDGEELSTTDLLVCIGDAMGRSTRLIPIPVDILMCGANLLGKKMIAQQVLGSLQVDISKARNLLGWQPPVSIKEGLRRCFAPENVS